MTGKSLKCPICDTEVAASATECPSCGLPKDFWPEGEGERSESAPLVSKVLEDLPRAKQEVESLPPAAPPPERAPNPEIPPVPSLPSHPVEIPTPMIPSREPAPPEATKAPESPVKPTLPPDTPEVQKEPEPKPVPVTETVRIPALEPKEKETSPARQPETEAPVPPPRILPEPVAKAAPAPRHAEEMAQPADTTAPATFEHAMGEVRNLMGLTSRYSIEIGAASNDVSKATKLWKLGEVGQARVAMVRASELLKRALEAHCRKTVESIEKSLTKLGPFAPEDARDGARRLETQLTRQEYEGFLSETTRISTLLNEREADLGPTAKFISALRAIDSGIISLGGKSVDTEAVLDRAYASYLAGQPQRVEALLGLTVGEALEALAPLLAVRISQLTQSLKKAHEKGQDTHEAAILLKQVTIALRSRNYLQVLGLLHRIEEKLPRETSPEGVEEDVERKPHRRRIKGRSTSPPPARERTEERAEARFEMPVIRKGHSYLFLDSHPNNCLLAFLETKGERAGLVVTSTFPPKVIELTPLPNTDVVWVSETEGWVETYHPKTLDHEISARILDFLRSENPGTLCIDGLGQLISSNGGDRVEKFLKLVLDVSSSKNVSVVTTLAPDMVDEKVLTKVKALFDHIA